MRLNGVGNYDVPRVFSINSHVNNRSRFSTGNPLCADFRHKFFVANADDLPVNLGFDTAPGNFLDSLNFDEPKTKKFVEFQKAFGVDGCKSLFITRELIDNVTRSSNNLQNAKAIAALQLNVYDILNSEKLFLTKDAVAKIEEVYA